MANRFKKIVVFDNIVLSAEQKERLHKCATEIVFYPKTEEPELVKQRIRGADAIINCWTILTEDIINEAPNLKYIGNWGHWWKNRILVSEEKLKKLGIHLDYVPDYGVDAVAELVWGGILALSRNLEKWHSDAGKGKWTYENIKRGDKLVDPEQIQERTLKGKVLGIVGMGKIGYRVAQIGLHGFGVKVVYHSRTRKKEAEEQGIEFVSLQDLFKTSDIVSIHVSTDAPEKLISKDLLALLKPGAVLVNTSVGHAIDLEALIELLKQGKIKAFLDVYQQFPPKKELENLPNVLFTYRLGWFTRESLKKKGNLLLSNIENYLGA